MTDKMKNILSRVLSGEIGRQSAMLEKETDETMKYERNLIIDEVKMFMQENSIGINDVAKYGEYFTEKMK